MKELTALVEQQQATIAAQPRAARARHRADCVAEESAVSLRGVSATFPRRSAVVVHAGNLRCALAPNRPPTSPRLSRKFFRTHAACQEAPAPPEVRLPQCLRVRAESSTRWTTPNALAAAGGQRRVVIGEVVTKQLEIEPAGSVCRGARTVHVACARCRDGQQVVTTSKPPAAIEKSPFGASMLAWIVSAKLERHLPLYRQQEMLLAPIKRWLSRSLLCKLMQGTARALKTLADRLLQEVLLSCVVQADETPVRYLPGLAGKSSWDTCSGTRGTMRIRSCGTTSAVAQPGRGRVSAGWLSRFFAGRTATAHYDSLVAEFSDRLTAVACWGTRAVTSTKRGYTTSHPALHQTLAWIQQLYDARIAFGRSRRTSVWRCAGRSRRRWWRRSLRGWRNVRPELRSQQQSGRGGGLHAEPQACVAAVPDRRPDRHRHNRLERLFGRQPSVSKELAFLWKPGGSGQTAARCTRSCRRARWHRLDVQTYLTEVLRRLPACLPTTPRV